MMQCISPIEAKTLFDKNNVLLCDVRDSKSYQKAHIKGAQHLIRENFTMLTSKIKHSQIILVYCYHGNSSKIVANMLTQQGYTNVYSLDGGFEDWCEKFPDTIEYES